VRPPGQFGGRFDNNARSRGIPPPPGRCFTSSGRGGKASRLAQMGNSRFAPLAMRPPSDVVRRIVSAIEHNRARCVVEPDARAVDAFVWLVPGRSGLIGRMTSLLVGDSSGSR